MTRKFTIDVTTNGLTTEVEEIRDGLVLVQRHGKLADVVVLTWEQLALLRKVGPK